MIERLREYLKAKRIAQVQSAASGSPAGYDEIQVIMPTSGSASQKEWKAHNEAERNRLRELLSKEQRMGKYLYRVLNETALSYPDQNV